MAGEKLLLVDDDRHLLESMAQWLRGCGFEVTAVSTCRQAHSWIDQQAFDLILADIRMGDGDGFEVLGHVRRVQSDTPVVLITGYATVETGIEALRAGAFDLLTKPLLDEELLVSIRRGMAQRQVIAENRQLKAQLDQRFGLDNIVLGQDDRMRRLYEVIESVAATRATVLITGESGTGKSMIARAIHRRSPRKDRPFIEVACGALPDTLLETELFGHVAGAFTGAVGSKIGKFKQADTGTIFLDEIGTASQSLQVKLLRVLQDFEFEAVGGTETHKIDARVILATNENLQEAVSAGTFRQDLYYRVNVINLELPALRQRVGDIPLLAQHFLAKVAEEMGKEFEGFSSEAMDALQLHSWPGNIRELRNVIERAVLLGKGPLVRADDLGLQFSATGGARLAPLAQAGAAPLKSALAAPERQIILEMLEQHHWNRNATAEALGINRTTLYKKMKRLKLEDPRQLAR
ncbi:MAG: sigma-54 dependent transcriptional regulator [Pirellulales bacterium]